MDAEWDEVGTASNYCPIPSERSEGEMAIEPIPEKDLETF
jgi:hypothetical protein